MTVEISSDLLARIIAEAAASDVEICGLLLGAPNRIAEARACRNVAAEPARRFELDPAALIAAHRASRAGGAAVIGHYHSHPTGSPVPSACDAAKAAADGSLWLIVAAGEARAWRAVSDGAVHGRFDPVELAITPACAADSARPERPRQSGD